MKIDEYIFSNISGVWRRVDSLEPTPLILADFLKQIICITYQ